MRIFLRAAPAWLLPLVLCACGGKLQPLAPVITAVQPLYVIAGTGGFILSIDAQNVKPNQVLVWNGAQLPTQAYVGSGPADYIGLSAPVPASYISQPGRASITVLDPDTGAQSAPAFLGIDPSQQAEAGVVALVSAAPDGSPADGDVLGSPPAASGDGRYIAFQDTADNLVSNSRLGLSDIYLRDTCLGAPTPCTPSTLRISVAADGGLANDASSLPVISSDGRFVAFGSFASNIVVGSNPSPGASTPGADIYLRDTCIGAPPGCVPQTTVQSPAAGDAPVEGGGLPSLSASGRYIAYSGQGSSGIAQVYWRDTCAGVIGCTPTTLLASPAYTGGPADAPVGSAALSATGRFIGFLTAANNLVPNDGDSGDILDVFLHDTCQNGPATCSPSTLRADLSNTGAPAAIGAFGGPPAVSADGRYVAFSMKSNETAIAPNPGQIVTSYIRDTCTGVAGGCQPRTLLIPVGLDNSPPNAGSDDVSMTPDGRYVAFGSLATNLTYGQIGPAGNQKDIFVRDTCFGATQPCTPATIWVSVGPNQAPSLGDCDYPAISADGHYVAFLCVSDNLLPGTYNGHTQVYLARTGF